MSLLQAACLALRPLISRSTIYPPHPRPSPPNEAIDRQGTEYRSCPPHPKDREFQPSLSPLCPSFKYHFGHVCCVKCFNCCYHAHACHACSTLSSVCLELMPGSAANGCRVTAWMVVARHLTRCTKLCVTPSFMPA